MKMVKQSFPHEIGVILGYPLEDVKGYMENGGQKCLLNGYWKVYNNPEEAKRKFEIGALKLRFLFCLFFFQTTPI